MNDLISHTGQSVIDRLQALDIDVVTVFASLSILVGAAIMLFGIMQRIARTPDDYVESLVFSSRYTSVIIGGVLLMLVGFLALVLG